jgi:hypothetical protein
MTSPRFWPQLTSVHDRSLAEPRRFVLTFLLLFFTFARGSLSAAEHPSKAFDVAADVAERSLKIFSSQAGLEVIFPSALAKNVRTKSVKGTMQPRDALQAMLRDTGLALHEDETGAFTVRRESSDPNGSRAALTKGSARPRRSIPVIPTTNR